MGTTGNQPGKQSAAHGRTLIRRFRAGLDGMLGPDWPWVAAVLLVVLAAAWPAVSQPGLLNTRGGGDSPFLLQRLHQLAAALADGHFPARWMPDANYGYGYPFYNYYAPLSIYIAAAFRFLGFSFVRAIHLAQLAGFAVAGLGMFYLGRRWLGSSWAGLLAAVAYTVAPFHMVNVYVRGDSLAEFWAMAFYPLVLLAADGIFGAGERGSRGAGENERALTPAPLLPRPPALNLARPVATFALAYAALILSHNISALIFSPFLLLYMLIRLLTRHRPPTAAGEQGSRGAGEQSQSPSLPVSNLLISAVAILLALALAAWFFVPALAEQDLARLGPVTEGYFHYSNHFRGLDLVQGGLLFDYNPDGGVAFRLGLVQAVLAVAGAAVLLRQSARKEQGSRGAGEVGKKATSNYSSLVTRHSSLVIVFALIAVFMITPLSRPLWDHLPLLPFTQFPWRFLSVASLFLALLTGGLVLAADHPAERAAIAVSASLVLAAAGLLGLRVDHLLLTDADVTSERLAQYEWFTGNIGTTVSAEYLTPAAAPRPYTSPWLNDGDRDRVVATAGSLSSAELVERKTTRRMWRLSAGEGGAEVLFPILDWPGWRATVDGQPAELRALPSSGLMALTLPAGEHEVVVQLGRTPVRLVAEWVSLSAAVAILILFVIGRGAGERGSGGAENREQSPNLPISSKPRLSGLLISSLFVLCGLLLAAFLWRGDPDDRPRGDLTWDFAQMGYLHHTPGSVAFTDGARLFEYGYSADTIAAGETLTVTLSIEPGTGGAATLALVTPASARPTPNGAAEPPPLATQTIALNGETAVFTLPISAQAPAGLYVPRFTIEGAKPLMPSGETRGDLFLRPLRVTTASEGQGSGGAGEQGSPPGASPTALLDVRPLAMVERDATTLDGQFAWLSSRPLGGRYQLSWRLQNGEGAILSQLDGQPGYGFNPTDGWVTNEPVNDWLALRLPDALSGPPPYPLVMVLYDVTTGEQLLVRRVGEIVEADGRAAYESVAPMFTFPPGVEPAGVTFGDGERSFIRLSGYEMEQTAGTLALSIYWQALTGDIPADYTRFVHLLDASGAVVAQVDGHPAGNSYPTGQWVDGEFVADTVRLDLSALPPGEYQVATGFYRPTDGQPRLDATGPDGPLPDGRALLPESIVVPVD